MLDSQLRVLNSFRRRLIKILTPLHEEQFLQRPAAGLNPPVWLLGHIVVCLDDMATQFQRPLLLSPHYHQMFCPGSIPFAQNVTYPSKAELIEALNTVVARTEELARLANHQNLEEPHGVPALSSSRLQSRADFLELMLVGHIGLHLGQLEWAVKLLAANHANEEFSSPGKKT